MSNFEPGEDKLTEDTEGHGTKWVALPADDDTEGHGRSIQAAQAAQAAEDTEDTEGHVRKV